MPDSSSLLERELWTSWASCLRAYAGLHGLASAHPAVVEVGAEEILLRVDTRWLRFTHDSQTGSKGEAQPFSLHANGTVSLGSATEEMDLLAERVTRDLLLPA